MPANHCFRCMAKPPTNPRKKGWHSICSDSGHTRCCPTCAAEMGLPAPTQLPEKPKKDLLTRKIAKRALLNLLVKQGYLQHGQLVKADKQRLSVTIDKLELDFKGLPGTIPWNLGVNAGLSVADLSDRDKAGPVYYRQVGSCIAWLIWDIKGRKDLQAKVRVKITRDGAVVVEG